MKRKGELRSVGAWLFPAPFKILAVAHEESWKNKALEGVVMPNGTQVDHALSMLRKDGVANISNASLASGAGTFEDQFANLWDLQRHQIDLAHKGGSSVLHINGALHELGKRL